MTPQTLSPFHYSRKCSKACEYNNIQMTLIGGWSDIAAYYEGRDGNAWMFHLCTNGWSNLGPVAEFKLRLAAGRRRGELIGGAL